MMSSIRCHDLHAISDRRYASKSKSFLADDGDALATLDVCAIGEVSSRLLNEKELAEEEGDGGGRSGRKKEVGGKGKKRRNGAAERREREGNNGGGGSCNSRTGPTKSESLLTDEVELDDVDEFDDAVSEDENDLLPAMLGLNFPASSAHQRTVTNEGNSSINGNSFARLRHTLRRCVKRASITLGCCLPWASGFTQFK